MGKISAISYLCLVANLLAVHALEDPDLIRHCGDAKALALGLSPSKHHEAGGITINSYSDNHVQSAPQFKYESYNLPSQTHSYSQPSVVHHSGYNYPVPSKGLTYPSVNLQQHGHQGYAVSEGLNNYASQQSTINFGNIHSYIVPKTKATYLPPTTTKTYAAPIDYQSYSTLAPILSYEVPNSKTITKLTSVPSVSVYNTHSSQSASSFSAENSFSSSKYESAAPAISLHSAPTYGLPIYTASTSKAIIPSKTKLTPPISYFKKYAPHENLATSSHSSYPVPAIKYSAVQQPIFAYTAPAVTYSSGADNYHNSATALHNSKASDSSSAVFSASPGISSVTYGNSAILTYSSPVNNQLVHAPIHKVVAAPAVASYVNAPTSSISGGLQSYSSGLRNHYTSSHDNENAYSSGGVPESTVSISNGQHHTGGIANANIQTYHQESKPIVAAIQYSSAPDVSSSHYINTGHGSDKNSKVSTTGNQYSHVAGPAHITFDTPVVKTSVKTVAKPFKIKNSQYYDAHPSYTFEYGVNDPHSGDHKHQKEVREGDVVHGEYSLEEPDGTIRTVKYHADWETGFHATVTKSKKI